MTEPIAALVEREAEGLASAWRDRCAAAWPGSPPSATLAGSVVDALGDALRLGSAPDGSGRATAADRLRVSLEVDPESAVSVEQLSILRELLHRRSLEALDPGDAIAAVEALGRLVDVLVLAVTDRAYRRLEAAAFLDPLTGAGNRRALDRDAAPLLAAAARHGRPFSVIVIDLDGLKRINDNDGHAAGDEAIRRLATTLTRHLRTEDAVYRVGGDEFVVLLPETRPVDVPALVDRAVGQAPPFSFGVGGYPDDGLALDQLIDAADRQLLDGRRRRRGAGIGGPEAADEAHRRIGGVPWPERAIEDVLYELDEVLAARVTDEGGVLHVGVLVRPGVTAAGLLPAILEHVRDAAGSTPELLDLRVMPLGETAEHVSVRSNGEQVVSPGPATPPGRPPEGGDVEPDRPAESSTTRVPAPPPEVPARPPVAAGAGVRVGPATATRPHRPALERITAVHEGAEFSAEVVLRLDGRSVAGRASGKGTRGGVQRLVAEATAHGLAELHGRHPGVEFADVLTTGEDEIAVVAVADLAVDDLVTGSAVVRGGNRLDAIARAVLDATNRRWSAGSPDRR